MTNNDYKTSMRDIRESEEDLTTRWKLAATLDDDWNDEMIEWGHENTAKLLRLIDDKLKADFSQTN